MPKRKPKADARVIARLDDEEQEILRLARAATGQNTSAVIKAALRSYGKSLPRESALAIFERHGVIGAVSGPSNLSETYKSLVDYSHKHGGTE
jgi:uncharacterized protein (DUF1778 family)